MIYIDQKKLTVDGVDVYPDHISSTQFWYIPGTIRLAQRNNKKVLSYLWYTDSETDNEGIGFLNFEVNTAVPKATLDEIEKQIVAKWKPEGKITLSTVPYHTGSVSFSVLGGGSVDVAKAGDLSKDPSVVYQSKEQLVWNAGSSSLVGDNAAVCSVRFSKEGKLAGAMDAVLENKLQNIAALYRLEFLAMRPSVTFTVKGTFEKTIQDFQASIGASIPLEVLLLDIGVQAQWQKIMQKTDLKIEVVNYTGENEQDGLKWAQQVLLDYVLKNFFEVQLGAGKDNWSPLSKAPEIEETVQKAKDVELAASDKADEKADETPTGKDDDKPADKDDDAGKDADSGKDDDKDKEPEKEPEKDTGKDNASTEKDGAVKQLIKAAAPFIPKVSVRASYYQGSQVNSIDFMYSEKKAKSMPVLPQALIALDANDKIDEYVVKLNRAGNPFGRPYNVVVSIPDEADQTKVGLQALNVQARYPAGAPSSKQTPFNLTVSAGKTTGQNPLPFQYDAKGSAEVEYTADFVFKPSSDWDSDTFQYSLKGTSEKGLITAMAESVVEFLTISVALGPDFVWDVDQAVVTLTSAKWKGEKRVVFQKGAKDAMDTKVVKIRSDARFQSEPVQYSVDLRKANRSVHAYGPLPVMDKQITVVDVYANHIPVYFTAGFKDESVDITLTYQDGDYVWEDQFSLEAGEKKVQRIIPTLKDLKLKSELEAQYEVTPESGDSFKGTIKGGMTRVIKTSA